MSDQPDGLREIAQQLAAEWWSSPSTDVVPVVLERAMRLAIEATARCEGKMPDEEYFADIAEQMEALLEAKANK